MNREEHLKDKRVQLEKIRIYVHQNQPGYKSQTQKVSPQNRMLTKKTFQEYKQIGGSSPTFDKAELDDKPGEIVNIGLDQIIQDAKKL